MTIAYIDRLSTPNVLEAQENYYLKSDPPEDPDTLPESEELGTKEIQFISSRDSFYLATVNQDGWPYVQHRGGSTGFLKVLTPGRLAFADLRGNRQLLSTGHLSGNSKLSLLLMDYPKRQRLKIMGNGTVLPAKEHPELATQLADERTRSTVERIFTIDVVSYDWNCPKFITPRYTKAEIEPLLAPFQSRIAQLERQLTSLSDTSPQT